ncbi:latexin isoform X1 [Nelusetta ayraudi]|uniref:latexin isoform X1 n=2 Tax=Nelusetta ayraudi TaxID=303726 RepID=UPI003F6F8281
MSLALVVILVAFQTGASGSPSVTMMPEIHLGSNPSSGVPDTAGEAHFFEESPALEKEEPEELVMATGELNPNYYPAQRAAKVVQHYLNTRYGSPCRLFGLHRVHSANAQDVDNSSRNYQLEVEAQEIISNTTGNCSAGVLFDRSGERRSAQVQASCEELLKVDALPQEEAFYQQCKTNGSVSAENLPDSHGRIDPGMTPLWHLATVASSFIMLNESTEDTLYNMAQVANITQLPSENDQLKFDSHVLLHDMVSQEILHWKLLFTWSPAEGVKVLQMEQLPYHNHQPPQSAN